MSPTGTGPAVETPASPGRARDVVPREVLKQVRLIELRTRGWVDSLFSGEYHSVFKGQGIEFSEVREYQPGDDVRNIDWNVTARAARPYVKKHVEERELTVLLVVDLSGSEQFGTKGRFKAELAAEIAAVLALSATRNNDRVGLLIFTDVVEHFVPPRKGRRHTLRMIRDVLAFSPERRGTSISPALDFAGRLLRHRSIVFVLSDFQVAPGGMDALQRTMKLVGKRHDLVAVRISDPREAELPNAGLLVLTDPETGERVVVDSGSRSVRTDYARAVRTEREAIRRVFRQTAVDEIEVSTDASYIGPLLAFFRRREKRRR
ncbi:MAG TPA: DUF58 domain-containing protein [Longimicrobiales bacterium]